MNRYSKGRITSKKMAKFFFLKYPFSTYRRTFQSGYIQVMHEHDFPQIWLCTSGKHTHEIAGSVFTCRRGDLLIIPSGVSHSFKMTSGVAELYCIDMAPEIFEDATDDVLNALCHLFLPSLGGDYAYHFHLSRDSYTVACDIAKKLTLADCKELVFENLKALFSLPELELKTDKQAAKAVINEKIMPVLHVIHYMNNNFSKKITAEEMIKLSALCRTHFFKYFKALTGSSFSAYLQELRLAYAFILIGNSKYPLSHIATLCGFSDAYYMTNCYKKYTGISPNITRPAVREDFAAVKKRTNS